MDKIPGMTQHGGAAYQARIVLNPDDARDVAARAASAGVPIATMLRMLVRDALSRRGPAVPRSLT